MENLPIILIGGIIIALVTGVLLYYKSNQSNSYNLALY